MEGRGSPSFVHFTLLINRQVVANGNRVPSPNLKCMHTAGSALYNMLLWSFFCNKVTHAIQVREGTRMYTRVKASLGERSKTLREERNFISNAQSSGQRRGIRVKTVTACWPRGRQ